MTIEQWKKDFEESSKFIQDLSFDYTWIGWGEGSMSISDVPKGWEKIIRNLFGAINQYSNTKIYYLEDTRITRFKIWWNYKISMIFMIIAWILIFQCFFLKSTVDF